MSGLRPQDSRILVFRISGLASLIQTSTTIEQDALGQHSKKRVKRSTKDLKEQLVNLCRARRDDMKTMQELLRGVAHIIHFFVKELK